VPVSQQLPDLTGHWAGFAALAIFAAAYALVIAEEVTQLLRRRDPGASHTELADFLSTGITTVRGRLTCRFSAL
jgi:hypothetical protein